MELTARQISQHMCFEAAPISGVVGRWHDDAPDELKLFEVSIYRHYSSHSYIFWLRGPYKPKYIRHHSLDIAISKGFAMIAKTLQRSRNNHSEFERLAALCNASIPHLWFEEES